MTTMSPRRVLHRTATIAVGVLAGVATAGTAYAVWTSSGTGSGAASSSSFQTVVVTAGTATPNQLYPGGTGDLFVSASNPNPFPVTVTVSSISGVTSAGCTTPGITLVGTPSFTLPANSGTVTRTMTGALSMNNTSTSDCQGKTFTVNLATSASS